MNVFPFILCTLLYSELCVTFRNREKNLFILGKKKKKITVVQVSFWYSRDLFLKWKKKKKDHYDYSENIQLTKL